MGPQNTIYSSLVGIIWQRYNLSLQALLTLFNNTNLPHHTITHNNTFYILLSTPIMSRVKYDMKSCVSILSTLIQYKHWKQEITMAVKGFGMSYLLVE